MPAGEKVDASTNNLALGGGPADHPPPAETVAPLVLNPTYDLWTSPSVQKT